MGVNYSGSAEGKIYTKVISHEIQIMSGSFLQQGIQLHVNKEGTE